MYPAALHKIPTQTVDSAQSLEKWNLQKQQKKINKMKETQSAIWNTFVPNKTKISSLDCYRQRHI